VNTCVLKLNRSKSILVLLFQIIVVIRFWIVSLVNNVNIRAILGDCTYVLGNRLFLTTTPAIIGIVSINIRYVYLYAEKKSTLKWTHIFIPMINHINDASQLKLTKKQYIQFKFITYILVSHALKMIIFNTIIMTGVILIYCGFYASFNSLYSISVIIIWIIIVLIWTFITLMDGLLTFFFFYITLLYLRYRFINIKHDLIKLLNQIKSNEFYNKIKIEDKTIKLIKEQQFICRIVAESNYLFSKLMGSIYLVFTLFVLFQILCIFTFK